MASAITYTVFNTFTKQEEERPLEDWRQGWEPSGELVQDGLPVIRFFRQGSSLYALTRPYYLINAQNDYVVDPDTQKKVIEFVSPLFNWKIMVREDGNRLKPVHDKPLSGSE